MSDKPTTRAGASIWEAMTGRKVPVAKPPIPDILDAAPSLAALARDGFDSGMDWSDPKEEGKDGPRSAGLLDAAADCFLYRQPPRLRMSWGINCWRARFYDRYEGNKAKPANGADRMRMAQGYVFERLFLETVGGYLEEYGGPWKMDRRMAQHALTVEVAGEKITGHQDAALFYDGQPFAIADCKQTKAAALNYWSDGRMPGNEWGYRTQAGNYLRAAEKNLGMRFPYFVWFLSLRGKDGKHERVAIGWARREEVMRYADEAETIWLSVIQNPGKVPKRCNEGCRGVPCQTPTGIECQYLEWCQGDKR